MVLLALVQILDHRLGRGILCDNVEEKSAPANNLLLLAQVAGKLKVDGVLVGLENSAQHLASLETGLVDQAVGDSEQLREGHLDNLIKVFPRLTHLEAINAADGQQALQTGENAAGILLVQEIDGDVEEFGPVIGEIVVEDLLQGSNELGTDLRRRGSEDRDQALADDLLVAFRDGLEPCLLVLDGSPALCDAVLEVNNGWRMGQ